MSMGIDELMRRADEDWAQIFEVERHAHDLEDRAHESEGRPHEPSAPLHTSEELKAMADADARSRAREWAPRSREE